MHNGYDGGWSGWERLGGMLASAPSAITREVGKIDVVACGTDSAIWHNSYDHGWSGWQSLGGTLTSSPTLCGWSPDRLDVFARGTDSALMHNGYDGGWSGWERLGGMLASAPSAITREAGKIDVVACGTDSAIWHNSYDHGWSGWQSLGGTLTSSPTLCGWSPDRLDVFARGTDSALMHNGYDGGWSGWERLGGMLASAPSAITREVGKIDLLAGGSDSAIWSGTAQASVPPVAAPAAPSASVRIHAKIIAPPSVPLDDSLARMVEVYATRGISVEVGSTETLNIPELSDVEVGQCVMGQTSAEQNQLFSHRDNAGGAEAVVYFVRSTIPPYNGCAAHPDGVPAVVIAQEATEWTMAHEVGHVLGLQHVNDNHRLMTGNGTRNIINPPPELVPDEGAIIMSSEFSRRS